MQQVSIDSVWSAVRFREEEKKEDVDIVDAQFAGAKAGLRPLYERVLNIVLGLGPDVKMTPRQSYDANHSTPLRACFDHHSSAAHSRS